MAFVGASDARALGRARWGSWSPCLPPVAVGQERRTLIVSVRSEASKGRLTTTRFAPRRSAFNEDTTLLTVIDEFSHEFKHRMDVILAGHSAHETPDA